MINNEGRMHIVINEMDLGATATQRAAAPVDLVLLIFLIGLCLWILWTSAFERLV